MVFKHIKKTTTVWAVAYCCCLAALLLFIGFRGSSDNRRPFPNLTHATEPVTDPLQQFRQEPTDQNWQHLVGACSATTTLPYAKTVGLLSDFHEHRLSRDLPNSMAQLQSPNAAVHATVKVLSTDFDLLKVADQKQMQDILNIIVHHPSDEDLVWTAAELEYRLSPQNFATDRNWLASNRSSNLVIFDAVRDRFIAGHGRIGEW